MSREPSINNFGLLIAYLLPGFATLLGSGLLANPHAPWLAHASAEPSTVGGFLYITLASILAGLTVSTVRWLIIDAIHHHMGVRPPPRDFARLGGNEAAFGLIVDDHYRYYQFYGNMIVALAIVLVVRHTSSGADWARLDGIDALLIATGIVFFAGSRDTLRKFYDRSGQLLQMAKLIRRNESPGGQVQSTNKPGRRHAERGGELVDVDQ